MGISERREREREQIRTWIVEAARDLLSEGGLAALSMRAIAERIEYSPATIYLYFKDKDELIREVVHSGFEHLAGKMEEEIAALGEAALDPVARYGALGRAYVRFALENTAYFRVMFELPAVPQLDCPPECGPDVEGKGLAAVVATLEEAMAAGRMRPADAERAALISWAMMHGLTSLYLTGHLSGVITSNEAFFDLVEEAKSVLYEGFKPAA